MTKKNTLKSDADFLKVFVSPEIVRVAFNGIITSLNRLRDDYRAQFSVFDGIPPGIMTISVPSAEIGVVGALMIVGENLVGVIGIGDTWIVVGYGTRDYGALSSFERCFQIVILDILSTREEAMACAIVAACQTEEDRKFYVNHNETMN